MNNICSDKELELFRAFGYDDKVNDIPVVDLYRLCVQKAFLLDLRGPHVNSLRECYKAILSCSPYRMTPEFDELIQL